MSQFTYPTQRRYNDPYDQLVTTPGSVYKQKYLSQIYNNVLRAFGNNIIFKGLKESITYNASTINISLSAGTIIQDSTLINFPSTTALTADVSHLSDSSMGSFLVIVLDFLFTETPDLDSQTSAKMHIYHVDSTGLIVTPLFGCPTFDPIRSKTIISVIDFYRPGPFITSAVARSASLTSPTSITILGTTYAVKGQIQSNLTFYDAYAAAITSATIDIQKMLFYDMNNG